MRHKSFHTHKDCYNICTFILGVFWWVTCHTDADPERVNEEGGKLSHTHMLAGHQKTSFIQHRQDHHVTAETSLKHTNTHTFAGYVSTFMSSVSQVGGDCGRVEHCVLLFLFLLWLIRFTDAVNWTCHFPTKPSKITGTLRLTGNQSKCRWCNFSADITLCSIYLLYLKLYVLVRWLFYIVLSDTNEFMYTLALDGELDNTVAKHPSYTDMYVVTNLKYKD